MSGILGQDTTPRPVEKVTVSPLRDVVITSPLESNGAIPVNIQDQHSQAFDLFFSQDVGSPTTLTVDTEEDAYSISVTTGHGLVATNDFVLIDSLTQRGYTGQVVSVVGDNVVNVDRPLTAIFPSASTVVQQRTKELSVNGSVTRQTFSIGSPLTAELDITRFMLHIITASAVDLSKFGDLAALTRGCVLRVVNGRKSNLQNYKSNGEMSHSMFDLIFFEAINPSQGVDGICGRLTYAGQDKHGVTIRIGGGESVEFIIQDDLTGLTSFRLIAAGHIVTD